jgi:uncharacterized protein (TIGR03437 family)
MPSIRLLFFLAAFVASAWCQKPVIFPGGVVNAASYAVTTTVLIPQRPEGLSPGSIASIFGANLAYSTETASTIPLPTQLAGTSVTVHGFPAPLFYVSPSQINFQMPWRYTGLTESQATGVVVTTAAGSSDLYPLNLEGGEGIFTMDSSGCGQGAVLNVSADGSVSVNSPSNSASPDNYISIYGTGQGYSAVFNIPPDGTPPPPSPSPAAIPGLYFDFVYSGPYFIPIGPTDVYWAGLAPGLIGVDQFNFQIPETAREGCAVPLQVSTLYGISQPVTIAIHKGGGPCVDPPSAGYGQITWEKTITTNPPGGGSNTESDTLTVSLQASPGKQAPVTVFEGPIASGKHAFGPSCPVPGYRSLDAGDVSVQGPGFGLPAAIEALKEGPVSGLHVYSATLPAGTIRPGAFQVIASGGADAGAFQSTVQIGPGINITTPLAGITVSQQQPFTVNWTGGDPNSWVTVRLVYHYGYQDRSAFGSVRASDGAVTFRPAGVLGFGLSPGRIEIVVEVSPDPSQVASFSAPGISLGGRHTWKYTYRFEGVTLQ